MIIDIILMRVSEITSRSFCKSKTKIQSEGAKQLNVSPFTIQNRVNKVEKLLT